MAMLPSSGKDQPAVPRTVRLRVAVCPRPIPNLTCGDEPVLLNLLNIAFPLSGRKGRTLPPGLFATRSLIRRARRTRYQRRTASSTSRSARSRA
jgi:hypothetical protein